MYDVCYETNEYLKAIDIVTKLIEFKIEYKEDLVSLYMNTQQFDKALDLINELNEKVGKSELRDNYKYQILQEPEYQSMERINLINQIKKYPKEESNYIALIALYYKNNLDEKALELSKLLSQEIPTSDWAQVNLFQLYLISNDDANVVKSMIPSRAISISCLPFLSVTPSFFLAACDNSLSLALLRWLMNSCKNPGNSAVGIYLSL